MPESSCTPHNNHGDSLGKRYLYKLLTNLVSLPVYFVTQAIIPRGLGPQAYGDFNFLTNFFSQVMAFLDMGTSIGFYTKLSQRPHETALVSFYFYFLLVSVITLLGGVTVATQTSLFPIIWPHQEIWFIYLAAVWAIMTWVLQLIQKITDSYGLTVNSEIARMLQRIAGMVFIVILFWFNLLRLTSLFFLNFLIMGLLIFGLVHIIRRENYNIKLLALSLNQIKIYIKEFYHYSHPLFIYALVGLVAGIFDRWLLQVISGSVEQGFYGLAYQIGSVCLLFTSAMAPLLAREFSIAFGKKDLRQMAYLFRRYIPLLYSIAAYFSCFVAVQADKVIYIMGGKDFGGALMAATIMAFYPMYQTYGQLSGSVFYATGQTGLYRNIGIIFLIIGFPVSYFLMAPYKWFGLGLGSVGLAIKIVLLAFLGINVQLWYNTKLLNLSFWEYFSHQIYSVAIFISLSIITAYLTDRVLNNLILNFVVSGIIYTIICIVMLYIKPSLFYTSRPELVGKFEYIRNTLIKGGS